MIYFLLFYLLINLGFENLHVINVINALPPQWNSQIHKVIPMAIRSWFASELQTCLSELPVNWES